MTDEELSAAVALVCGEDRRFLVRKNNDNKTRLRWVVTMWRKKKNADPSLGEVWIPTGWAVHGETQNAAWSEAERQALVWADAWNEKQDQRLVYAFDD